MNSASYEYKNRSVNKGAQIRTHGNSNRLLEDLTTNNYKYVVDEGFQHLFNFNFGILVREIRVVFNKIVFFDD
jgi:hypothetical protein